jgi:hypothetical protein
MHNYVATPGTTGGIRVHFPHGRLTALPESLLAESHRLTALDVTGHALETLPDWLPELKRLKILFASQNPFTRLPSILGECPALTMVGFRGCQITSVPPQALPQRLQWLILTDNQLTTLPEALGSRPDLQKLMLSGNRLTSLPASLQHAHRLELLRVASNDFADFPDWLWELPRLAWLAVAGNPATPSPVAHGHEQVAWQELELGPMLGQGASGEIHQARWQGSVVAVKLFKNAMTSDGEAASEMAAALAVRKHRQLVGALAEVVEHPEGRQALLLPLIPADANPLAGPPDFSTCTRDVYSPGQQFTPQQAERLCTGVQRAMEHLHGEGFLHGDLYAHNVLWQPHGESVWLGDLGAASLPPAKLRGLAQALDQRALGILREEIFTRLTPG